MGTGKERAVDASQHMPIDTCDYAGLEALLSEQGQPTFRAKQLFEWLYGKGVRSYGEMTNLPASLRNTLEQVAPLHFPTVADKRVSSDGTRKYVLRLADGQLVETVGIPSGEAGTGGTPKRLSVCVSSQVGCPMGCVFCATGQQGLARNLTPGEIAWQVLVVAQDFDMRASNVVVMGQGEPFLNYDAVLGALRIINHASGPNIGARHITVSTCGIPESIRRFGHDPEQFTLAISLHAAQQHVRDRLMPGCAGMPLSSLKEAIGAYQAASGRRVTFEYLMMADVNTADEDLHALVVFCKGIKAHVNLLPINAVEGSALRPCGLKDMQHWAVALGQAGVEASVRTPRGADIDGACGQLKNKLQNAILPQ